MADAPYRNRTLEAYARRTDAMEADKDAEHALHKDLQKAHGRIEELEAALGDALGDLATIGAKVGQLEDENDRLADEVERLRGALESLMRNAKSVLSAQEVHPHQWKGLSSSISTARKALDAAEDGGHE
jgi:chromosome segregation ATPase